MATDLEAAEAAVEHYRAEWDRVDMKIRHLVHRIEEVREESEVRDLKPEDRWERKAVEEGLEESQVRDLKLLEREARWERNAVEECLEEARDDWFVAARAVLNRQRSWSE